MRHFLKHLSEHALTRSPLPALARHLRRHDLLILAYHNVVPDADAQARPDSLHLPITRFRRQLDLLRATARIVPLDEALAEPEGGGPPGDPGGPRVALTFDDAYEGTLRLALPELERRSLPATVFVCPGLLEAEAFWWDAFDASGHEETLFGPLAADHDAVRAYFAEQGIAPRPVSEWRRPGGLSLLEPWLGRSEGGIRFGAHTWTHPNLAALSEEAIEDQLSRTRAWLDAHVDRPSAWVACPYGRNQPAVGGVARRLGFHGALEIAGGWVPRGGPPDPDRVPRLNVPAGVSDRGFALRVAGLVRR